MKKFFLFLFLVSNAVFATPKKITIYFLSPSKVSSILYEKEFPRLGLISQNANTPAGLGLIPDKNAAYGEANCTPMGDGCFHPQLGYLEPKKVPGTFSLEVAKEGEEKTDLKTFNSLETSLVDCKKDYYFDIFCGKSNNKPTWTGELEVWFDVSSSLREVDFSPEKNHCYRRSFLENLQKNCDTKVRFAIYNTNIKELGDHANVCNNYGTNDEKRLIEWIKGSGAKHLVIVTDVDELSRTFRDFLDSEAASFVGDGVKPYTVKNLVDDVDSFAKICRNESNKETK